MLPLICTYWTNDTYKAMADAMFTSARKVGLRDQKGYFRENPAGTWRAGDSAKPEMVWKAVSENPERDILFIDSDCRFISFPIILHRTQHDMDMACYFENPKFPTSPVLWFRAGSGSRYAETWFEEMKRTPETPNDMFALTRTVATVRPKKILHLPPSYCWTEQWMRPRFGGAVPVIEHFAVGEHKFPGVHEWQKSANTIFKDGD